MRIQRFVKVAPGQTISSGSHVLGSFDEHNPLEQYKLRRVQVAPVLPYSDPYQCRITIPGGTVIGPIDVPFCINVPLPSEFVVTGVNSGSVEQTIMLTADDLPVSQRLDDATYLVIDETDGGPNVAIPDAVIAVSVLSDTNRVIFKNATGGDLLTVKPGYHIPRPRAAKLLNNPAEGGNFYLFHY